MRSSIATATLPGQPKKIPAAPLRLCFVGCGSRARAYAEVVASRPQLLEAVAIADPLASQRADVRSLLGDTGVREFQTGEELLAAGRLGDVAVITTQDKFHYRQAMLALRAGYDLLLEKPAACTSAEVHDLVRLANELGRRIVLCFVLRYTPFYRAVKRVLDSGRLGKLVSIQATEGVEPWHFGHSFVRGNWSVREKSTPMIVQKCSHDTDILSWLAGSECTAVSSFAGNQWFRPENAPAGATARCTDPCPHAADSSCPFPAQRYLTDKKQPWLPQVMPGWANASDDEILDWLRKGDWGRCVYTCGHDTPDHQVVSLQFASGVTAQLLMTAFDRGRRIRIHGTEAILQGSLHADGEIHRLELRLHHGGEAEQIEVEDPSANGYAGHGGGDFGLVDSLHELISAPGPFDNSHFMAGHLIAFAADAAFHTGRVIVPAELLQSSVF
ncbi:Gfo/Idh/MocA family oxidoreductase [Haloferula sp. BvORR071]|uniref:Gfo/Idh/MocA family protein n=1 Tax=Haloferula sp. BvORR071 TaxID=1396141 RepID=UPI000698EB9A|nr:Gfo/Idh/MocA family oxidoreductase [Haloferula sp. BvORR071]